MPRTPKTSSNKSANKRAGASDKATRAGLIDAIEQDVQLTVEQAEDATKRAVHKAAVALGIATGQTPGASAPAKSRPARATPAAPPKSRPAPPPKPAVRATPRKPPKR